MQTSMHRLIVMGVSGCGKSTLAAGIALSLGCRLIEGDELHLPESQAKMRQGKALQDSDREPWLDRLGSLVAEQSFPRRTHLSKKGAIVRVAGNATHQLRHALTFLGIHGCDGRGHANSWSQVHCHQFEPLGQRVEPD